MKKTITTLLLLFAIVPNTHSQEAIKIKPERKIYLKIPEPSDICLHPDGKSFFIVSDNGILFETDLEGTIKRQADYLGLDSEAVYANENYVFVAEEFSRKIKIFDIKNLELQRTVSLPYNGGRNKAYEAMTYNKAKNKFLLLTEKDPIYLFELDADLKITNEINLSSIARDISAATFFNDHVWLLSDEDRTVFKLDPNNYKVLSKWILPIINPEGLAFDLEGNMIILSDDMELMYYFKNPEK